MESYYFFFHVLLKQMNNLLSFETPLFFSYDKGVSKHPFQLPTHWTHILYSTVDKSSLYGSHDLSTVSSYQTYQNFSVVYTIFPIYRQGWIRNNVCWLGEHRTLLIKVEMKIVYSSVREHRTYFQYACRQLQPHWATIK